MRIYVSGPMTGYAEFNFPAFASASARLRSFGFTVINPAEIVTDTTIPWRECMKKDITAMLECDGIAVLEGWQKSKGASLECHIAESLGIPVKTLDEWLGATMPQAVTK